MSKCLIITSYLEKKNSNFFDKSYFDYIICADGGQYVAEALNIMPNLIIGDFDSSKRPSITDAFIVSLPKEKDLTDTDAAIWKAIEMGFRDITILGGLGGRIDHTLGNIALLDKYSKRHCNISIMDSQNYMFLIENTTITVKKNSYKFLSLISFSEKSTGVYIRGVQYPLTNATLTNSMTLGISNEIVENEARIKVENGKVLIIFSKDVDKC